MSFRATLDILDLLDDPGVSGPAVSSFLLGCGPASVTTSRVVSDAGKTDYIRALIPGQRGKTRGGNAPTLGIIGCLGGVGARPERIGLVSDADGAAASLAVAAKLARMAARGDILTGDVLVITHICPDAPTQPHEPVPFMGSPVSEEEMRKHEADASMDAVLSIDTTKGNRVINHRGFAISPTVKSGYILKVSDSLLDIMSSTTGMPPVTFPVSVQDITPYGNLLYHLNSIMQPCTMTCAPVVGVAITAETAVPGCATGASRVSDIDEAVRFALEVAKSFGEGKCPFYDEDEFSRLLALYGPMTRFQTAGRSRPRS